MSMDRRDRTKAKGMIGTRYRNRSRRVSRSSPDDAEKQRAMFHCIAQRRITARSEPTMNSRMSAFPFASMRFSLV
ncbi:hypothetical protein E3H11_06870 [Bradyrhizobium brasilense]|uniref:hypothetical protein n=1 Tax=Bradyrhizobium brasilense TaxID=1419277 RepID=UPI0014578867|nr:hypothetical protein [Bradyrhizobium brasilense]NLS68647.1 hypothetical protein [Bradyrhizobium brasilense]